ncbi:MAG: 4Fe-4S binding protein [Gammaproteobacteria bacterium]|nr:MAG: 4Fe-4S binding protein [Gammaproteobacteria bacterium]
MSLQNKRIILKTLFFALFLLAPVFDIFRFDLYDKQLIFLGNPWILDLSDKDTMDMTIAIIIKVFMPIFLVIGGGVFISYKYGRLYCGWLCPHFSIVEMVNNLMRRASGKLSMWQKKTMQNTQDDGLKITPHKKWWIPTVLVSIFFSFTWSVALLTYLLPPDVIYYNLYNFALTQYQFNFIVVATIIFSLDFIFFRHLFCRFFCAIGFFQSIAWMANKKALVVGWNRNNAKICNNCDVSCEHACPMRLKPRGHKRIMFTCTQCMKCIDSCNKAQQNTKNKAPLKMLQNDCALDTSNRGLGIRPDVPDNCFE